MKQTRRPRSADSRARSEGSPDDVRSSPIPAIPAWNPSDTAWAGGAALLATLVAAVLSHLVFGRMPHVQDSIAQLFQARIFAGGHLVAPAPPVPEFFEYTHMILKDGKWYSQYPPGHPLFLLLGVWIGQPWLINPILGGCALWGIYALGHELLGRTAARLAAGLALVSPFFLLMSAEFMAHASSLAALTWFLVSYLRWVRTGSRVAGAGAALAFALGMLVRPYSAFGFALPVVGHALWNGWRGRWTRAGRGRGEEAGPRARWGALAWCGAGAVIGGVLLLAYNAATTGHPLRFGYEELYGPSHGLGFGKGTWGPPHTLVRGVRGAVSQVRALDHRLFEWPLSSLWPLVLAILPLRGRAGGMKWWLLSFPLSLSLVHVFYWYRDDCFGPRYLYEALGPILLLTAAGLLRVHVWLAAFLQRRDRHDTRSGRNAHGLGPAGRVSLVLLLLLIGSGLAFRWPVLFRLPEAARGQGPESPYRQASYFQYFSREYWAVGPRLGEIVAAGVDSALRGGSGRNALVFVRMIEPPIDDVSVRDLWFGSAFARQEPYLERAAVIYAKDLGARNEELMRAYPDRAVFAFVGSVQGGEIRRLR